MKVIVVSGFLGSGKTSLISLVANEFATSGMRLAVIENEISPLGLDGKLLSNQGLRVKELASGCICCQLQGELCSSMEEISREYRPDLVFIEPTGAAAPGHVKEAIETSSYVDEIIMLVILDANRLGEDGFEHYPFVEQSILNADLIAVNKIDMVKSGIVDSLLKSAGELNKIAPVIPLSLESGENLKQFTEKLKSVKESASSVKTSHIKSLTDTHPVSTSFSMEIAGKINKVDIERSINKLLDNFMVGLKQNNCSRIGHVKIVIENGENLLFFSKTSFYGANNKKGAWSDNVVNCRINGSIIVYGLEKTVLEKITENILNKNQQRLLDI